MGMTEDAFFAQSIILWRDRLDGFRELHSGGKEPDEPYTHDDLEDLEARVDAERAASPPAPSAAAR